MMSSSSVYQLQSTLKNLRREMEELQLRVTTSSSKGVSRLRNQTVAVIGQLSTTGLALSDSLVKLGIGKLLLFDDGQDLSGLLKEQEEKWELDGYLLPYELEAYVSGYEFSEDSVDHLFDRIQFGGLENEKVSLVVVSGMVSNFENIIENMVNHLQGIPFLVHRENELHIFKDGEWIFLDKSAGTNLYMTSLELLIS